MYLARIRDKSIGRRYVIRQSYADGDCYRSRDLFDLGADPSRFIRYPGGNGFFIDPVVEDALADQGVAASQEDLEPIFIPFLDPHIRRVIDGFDRKSRACASKQACLVGRTIHRFDHHRLLYLKLGRVDPRRAGCVPNRFYRVLANKSRDEIEFDFIAAERILKPHEWAPYTYQIFDLERHFSEQSARSHPEGLDQDRMDRFFMKSLCRLDADEAFWRGSPEEPRLHRHLVRYALMYFDGFFQASDPFQAFLRDFMNRHRAFRPPRSVALNLAESARLFGVSVDTLKQMNCRALTRQYRKQALTHHPDRGGKQEDFVKLDAAYRKLMRRKRFGGN
jgi:hypothetical protein